MKTMKDKINHINTQHIENYSPDHLRNLACAILNESLDDYCGTTPVSVKRYAPAYMFNKQVIEQDLKAPFLVGLSDGMSLTVLSRLKTNLKKVKFNLKKMAGISNEQK
jgi:hypothetical protein